MHDQTELLNFFREYHRSNGVNINNHILNIHGVIARDRLVPELFDQTRSILAEPSSHYDDSTYTSIIHFCQMMIKIGFRNDPDFVSLYLLAQRRLDQVDTELDSRGYWQRLVDYRATDLFRDDKSFYDFLAQWGTGPTDPDDLFEFVVDLVDWRSLHQWSHQDGVLKRSEYLNRLYNQMLSISQRPITSHDELYALNSVFNVARQLTQLTRQSRWSNPIKAMLKNIAIFEEHHYRLSLTQEDLSNILDDIDASTNSDSMDLEKLLQIVFSVEPTSKVEEIDMLWQLYHCINARVSDSDYEAAVYTAESALLETMLKLVRLPSEMSFGYLYLKASTRPAKFASAWFASPYLLKDDTSLISAIEIAGEDYITSRHDIYICISAELSDSCVPQAFKNGYIDEQSFLERLVKQIADRKDFIIFNDGVVRGIENIIKYTNDSDDLWATIKPSISAIKPLTELTFDSDVYSYQSYVNEDDFSLYRALCEVSLPQNQLWQDQVWSNLDWILRDYQRSHEITEYSVAGFSHWNFSAIGNALNIYFDHYQDYNTENQLNYVQKITHYANTFINIHYRNIHSDTPSETVRLIN